MWYPISLALKDFLEAYTDESGNRAFSYITDRDTLKINLGDGNSGEYPAVDILFGEETQLDKKYQSDIVGGIVQLWIDLYIKGENSDDSRGEVVYKQIFNMGKDFLQLLTSFQITCQKDLGIATKFISQGILSDGGGQFPIVQHRIVLDIEWRK